MTKKLTLDELAEISSPDYFESEEFKREYELNSGPDVSSSCLMTERRCA